MTIDYNRKIIIMVAILSFGVVLILLTVISPAVRYIKQTSDQTQQLRQFLEQEHQQALHSRITRRGLADVIAASTEFDTFLFKKGDELKLITHLEGLAADYGLVHEITGSNLDTITNNFITISLKLSGDYNDIHHYIYDLERMNYFITIEHLQLTPVYNQTGMITRSANVYLTLGLYVSQ